MKIQTDTVFTEKRYMELIKTLFIDKVQFKCTEMFPGDWDRYRQALEMFDRVDLNLNSKSMVLDLGTPIPILSYYTVLKYDAQVRCKDISVNLQYTIGNVRGEHMNICKDPLGLQKWDFIIFTEVIEHLPCNMFLVREKVISSLKNGQYLFMSYPLGGRHASMKNYGRDIRLHSNWSTAHGHLREFTEDLALKFIPNLKIVDVQKVIPKSNPDGSIQILYKKEFIDVT